MFGPSEMIRAARRAVADYGADPARVQEVLQAVLAAQARGEAADWFAALTDAQVVSARQVKELRGGLDQTTVDPDSDIEPSLRSPGLALPSVTQAEPLGQLRQVGDYRILRQLGQGGMGAVFLGYHSKESRQVALKVLTPAYAGVRGALDRFHREAISGRSLTHANIVANYGAGEDPTTGLHYLVLEYVDGPSAHDLLERYGRLKVGDAVHIVYDVARALEYAHRNAIIHRDIKPANILLTTAGVAKLSDLGLARRTDETSHLTNARQGVGTPYYMPYEQALNARMADERSDLFALGATLYHLLTGEVPFAGDGAVDVMEKKNAGIYLPAQSLNPDVPDALERILARLLARESKARYASASQLIVDLEHSGLAAVVPSFVDPDLGLRDSGVHRRLAVAAQPTAIDVNVAHASPETLPRETGYWYLRYKNRHGRLTNAKLTQAQVLQRLREGKLSHGVDAARTPHGEFRVLRSYPEFPATLLPAPVAPEADKTIRARRPSRRAERGRFSVRNLLRRHTWVWAIAVALAVSIVALLAIIAL